MMAMSRHYQKGYPNKIWRIVTVEYPGMVVCIKKSRGDNEKKRWPKKRH